MPYSEVKSDYVHGNLVFKDAVYAHRWYDALGPNVVKWFDDFIGPHIPAANAPAGWTVTLVGASTIAATHGAGGLLLLTTAGAEDDGVNMQISNEPFLLTAGYPCYFGCRLKISDATQSDFVVGLCKTDTTLLGGMSEGIYFRKVDGSASVSFVLEEGSSETTGAVHTMTTDYVTLEWLSDGTRVAAFVNGVEQTRLAVTYLPDVQSLTPSIEFLTGDNAAITMTVDWIRVIQINA